LLDLPLFVLVTLNLFIFENAGSCNFEEQRRSAVALSTSA
jgi:hypothetical protein